jgi:hypothetical protein
MLPIQQTVPIIGAEAKAYIESRLFYSLTSLASKRMCSHVPLSLVIVKAWKWPSGGLSGKLWHNNNNTLKLNSTSCPVKYHGEIYQI